MWRRRMAMVVSVAVIVLTASACMESNACEVTALDGGGSQILCEGKTPVVSETEIPSSARCQVRGNEVVCTSGERFDVSDEADSKGFEDASGSDVGFGGSDAAGDDEGASVPGGGDFPGGLGGTSNGVGAGESACRVVGAKVLCMDGATADVDEGVENCVSRMVLGVGRRIVCDDAVEIVPDNGSVPGIEVACDKYEVSPGQWDIECSDGVGVLLDQGETIDEECVIETERVGNEVVISCGEKVWRVSLSRECMGKFYIETEADLSEFQERECAAWWGDVIIKGLNGVDYAYATKLRRISGSLEIKDNQTIKAANFPSLRWVGGDLIVQNNSKLEEISGWPRLLRVNGSVSFSANERVHSISPNPSYYVGGAWAISGHDRLTFIGRPARGAKPRQFALPDVEIKGPFLFLDNEVFGYCRTHVVWLWAMEHAKMAYIGNSGEKIRSDQWCEMFINDL